MPLASITSPESLSASSADSPFGFSLFHYVKNWGEDAIFHLIFFALVFLLVVKTPIQSTKLKMFVYTLGIMATAAISSSMILALPAGAAGYFSNPGMWICLTLIGTLGAPIIFFKNWSIGKQACAVMVVFSVATLVEKDVWAVPNKLFNQISFLKNVSNYDAEKESTSNAIVNKTMIGKMNYQIQAARSGENVKLITHVSPQFTEFWKQNEICWVQSFALPAITSIPMLRGLPPFLLTVI